MSSFSIVMSKELYIVKTKFLLAQVVSLLGKKCNADMELYYELIE